MNKKGSGYVKFTKVRVIARKITNGYRDGDKCSPLALVAAVEDEAAACRLSSVMSVLVAVMRATQPDFSLAGAVANSVSYPPILASRASIFS